MADDELLTGTAYIVLNIPSPMADRIRGFRAKFDPPRSAMAAEITLTGSSGAGRILPGQSLDSIAGEMNRIAAEFAPFSASFESVERFPGTDIYFLTLADDRPFQTLHQAFVRSSIRFEPSPYPFRPHCTLKLRSTPSDPELLQLFFMEVPKEPFILSMLSLYHLPDVQNCNLLHSVELTGGRLP